MSNLHPGLYPRSNEISLGSKLPSQSFMGMLACHLLLEGTISLRNQLLHLENTHTCTHRWLTLYYEMLAPPEKINLH